MTWTTQLALATACSCCPPARPGFSPTCPSARRATPGERPKSLRSSRTSRGGSIVLSSSETPYRQCPRRMLRYVIGEVDDETLDRNRSARCCTFHHDGNGA